MKRNVRKSIISNIMAAAMTLSSAVAVIPATTSAEEEIEAKPFNIFKCPKCGTDIDVNALGAHMRICQRGL